MNPNQGKLEEVFLASEYAGGSGRIKAGGQVLQSKIKLNSISEEIANAQRESKMKAEFDEVAMQLNGAKNTDIYVEHNGRKMAYRSVEQATKAMNLSAHWAGDDFDYLLFVMGEKYEVIAECAC